MKTAASRHKALIEFGVAMAPLPGQTKSGDLHLVKLFPGSGLVAVVDGSGHGEEAARAATLAVATLDRHAHEGLIALVRRCHEEIKRTRGAVMSLASFNGNENIMTWLGVGSVEGQLQRARGHAGPSHEVLLRRAGIVGYKLPPLRATVIPVSRGDTLIFTTDGIDSRFAEDLRLGEPRSIAQRICSRYYKGTDDGLVLVVRYLGSGEP
jgi:negative regulator of sigma-B (phosphoserine phosphatase)